MFKKYKANIVIIATFLTAVILSFTSCTNLFEEAVSPHNTSVQIGSLSGSISMKAPTDRSAFPVIPSDAVYYAEITDTATTSPKTWNGTADFTNLPSYTISNLDLGVVWKIEVGIKVGTTKIMSASHTMTSALTLENPIYTHNFELKATQTAAGVDTLAGKGNISLEIELEADSEITKCITSLSTDPITPASNKITLSKTDVASGTYSADFKFYTANDEIAYQFTESVSVFDNLTTNTWVRNGGVGSSPYLVEETVAGATVVKCRITNAMVTAFKQKTLYVSSTGTANGSGSFFYPLDSIEHAVNKMFDKNIDYKIYVVGTLISRQTIPDILKDTQTDTDPSTTRYAKSLTICGYTGLDGNDVPQDKIELNSGLSALIISTKVPVTIKNLGLTKAGYGLLVEEEDANVTLSDGVLISECDPNTISSAANITIFGSFYCSGSTVICLNDGKKIKLSGPLTKHSSTDKLKVIQNTYQRGNVIVEADGTNITDISAFKDCFDIDDGNDNEWACYLSADNSKLFVNAPYFVAPASSAPSGYENGDDDSTGHGTREYPYESIYRVTRDIHNNNIALDYTIKVAGTITGSQHIVKNGDSVYTDYSADNVINTDNAASITIIGARDLPDDGKPLDGISCGSAMPALYFSATGVPLTLKNIYLTDGCTGLRVSSTASVYIEEGTEIKENSRANGSYLAKGILMTGGTLYIKGGEIHDNRMSESGFTTMAGGLKLDSVTLYMSGGKIYNNTGYSGGGIANYYGTVYIYGSAVIGDENATNCAGTTNATRSNYATEYGGGIYSANNYLHTSEIPKVYIGYKPNEEGNPVVDENFTGGIYYNSASRGGGICNNATYDNNSPEVYIAKGTIAFNYASNDGGAIYSSGTNATYKAYSKLYISGGVIKENKVNTANNTALGGAVYATNFYLSGDASIPAGVTDATTHVLATGKQLNDIYIDSGYKITITGKLTPPEGSGGITATITPVAYTDGSEVVALSTSPAPDPATTLDEASACFAVTPQVVGAVTTNWYVIAGLLSDAQPVSSFTSAPASGTKVIASSVADIETINSWVSDSSNGLAGVTIKLGANLTLDSTFNKTIGPYGHAFKGTFDGCGYTITYDNASTCIIGYADTGAVIKNVNLEGTISDASLAWQITGTTVENCSSSCTVTSNYGSSGGLIDKAYATSSGSPATYATRDCFIKDCVFSGTVNAEYLGYMGGIVGYTEVVQIINCEMTGSITAENGGGIVGNPSGHAEDDNNGTIIENCCVTGTINMNDYGGGIVGNVTSHYDQFVFNCLFAGTNTSSTKGGIMGINTNIELEACYFVATADMMWWSGNASSNPPGGVLEIPPVSDTWITRLNEKNITAYAA